LNVPKTNPFEKMPTKSYIFDIKSYAINDGPGIRLTIFFKGCPLACIWCHNPESISPKIQKLYSEKKCIGAQKCIEVCPNDAMVLTNKGIVTDNQKCNLCGLCAEACPTKAFEISGKQYTTDQLLERIEKERDFFESSGGGVTLSGGEPMMHAETAIPLLEELGLRGIHRTVDTCGYVSSKTIKNFMSHTDLFLFDLKVVDEKKHLKYTGKSNGIIIENLKFLSKNKKDFIIRIPFIKGINTSYNDIVQFAELISLLPSKPLDINILPYHDIAKMKYQKMGSKYNDQGMEPPTDREIENLQNIFDRYNLEISLGG